MKWMGRCVGLCCLAMLLAGCAMSRSVPGEGDLASAEAAEAEHVGLQGARMLVHRASLSIVVRSVGESLARVDEIAKARGGYVDNNFDDGETYASLTLRVPSDSLGAVVASLESLGKVTSRHMSAEDVTEEYVDTDARVKNKIVLRDRLRQLLDKATDVKDILAIEKELSRVQAAIDSMQARLKVLKGQVDLATIDLNLQRRIILGPLGYLGKGAWWVVEKLFVFRW